MADFILDIDTKFLDRLEKAEKALEELVVSTNNVTNSFEKLATGGLSQFSTAIDKIVNKIDSLSSTKIGDFGVTDTANKVVSAVDNIDKAYETVRKINEESIAPNSATLKEEYVIVDIKKLEKEAEALEHMIKRVKRSRDDYKTKYQNLVAADSAPSKIRDAEVQFKTESKELSRLRRELKKIQDAIAEAQTSNKDAVSRMLTNAVDGFMPIASLKSYINEINTLLHEVPSLYPDPSEQQKVVDQLISLRKRYTDAMKSSEQKAQEYAKAKSDNAINLAREYEAAENGYDKLEKLEESHYEQMRSWREKSISEQSREDLYADEIKAYEEQVKAKIKADEDFAKREDVRIKERDAALDAAAKTADKRDEEILKENEAFVEKIRAKYADLIRETAQVSQELTRIEGLEERYGGDIDVSSQKNEYIARLAQLNQERLEIERDHQDKISSIQAEETKRRIKDEVDAAERAARQAIEARKKAEKEEEKYRGTYEGAMEYSKNTKSIQEQTQAIKYLKQARERLKRTDFTSEKEYRMALNKITLEMNRQTDSIRELNMEQREASKISGQLKSAITNMVGIGAIKGYVDQLFRIRGEFELQHKSLQVLLRNKDEANRLWEQTIDMAVKSPYRVDQLVTATKQLAAYRIETEKLHSTTKMLADLSSGLGIEINRLILAFGQVKAANFLRGTELRQFSEAGINILDELAAHYTALEGRIVSVGEVFDRVSKRMVSFADVETVLQNMTGEGGQFYKMQEQQAETLRGLIMNLKDSIMLMYNDIGEATDGILKKTLAFFKYMIDNWRSYANIITTVVGALTGYKAAVIASRLVTSLWNSVANVAAVATVKLGGSATWAAARVRLLNRTMSVNPFLRFISIITALGGAIFGLSMSFDKAGESAKSHLRILDENTIAAKNAAAGIKELTDERNELLRVENRSEEQERRLNDITSARTRLLGELTTANEAYAKSLKLAGDDSEAMAKAIEEQNAKIESQLALAYNLSEVDWEAISNAQTTQSAKLGAEAKYSVADKGNAVMYSLPIGTSQDWMQVMRDLEELIRSGVELSEVVEGLKESTKEAGFNYEGRKDKITSLIREVFARGGIGDIIADYIEADTVVDEALNTIDQKIADSVSDFSKGGYGRMLAEGLSSEIDETKNDALKKLQDYWEYVFTDESIPELAQELFIGQIAEIFNLEEGWFTKQISAELSAWQKGYNELLKTLTEGKNIPSLAPVDASTSIQDQARALNEFKETQEAIIKQYEDQQKYESMLPIHSKEDADRAREALSIVQQLLEAIGRNQKSGKTDTRYNDLIRTVNDVYNAFDKLEEKFGDTIATEMLWMDYSESVDIAFRKIGKSAEWVREQFGDLNSKESLKSALDWIAENASTQEARLQAKTASAKIAVDLEIEDRDRKFDKLTEQVEEMFSGYELAIELDKLHVPKEFANDFFNIDSIDITELRRRLAELKPEFDSMGAEEEYAEFLRKLDEMETKAQQERLKKYVEFTRGAISERGKILLEEAYTLADIDSAFTLTDTLAKNKGLISEEQLNILRASKATVSDLLSMDLDAIKELFTVDGIVTISDDEINNLMEYGELLAEQRSLAIEHAKEQTEQETAKLDWSLFKESEVFAQVFNDLENASDSLISTALEKLKEFKAVWADMDAEEFSEVLSMIGKLEAELALADPGKALKDAKNALKDAMRGAGDFAIDFSSENQAARNFSPGSVISPSDYNDYREALEIELAIRESVVKTRAQELAIAEREYNLTIQNANATDAEKAAAKEAVDNAKEGLKAARDNREQVAETLSLDQQRRDALDGIRGRMEKSVELANDLYDAFKGLAEVFFEEDSIGMVFADMGMQMMNTVMNTIMLQIQLKSATAGAMAFGTALNTAMSVIGWIVMGIQLLTMALTAAFKAHDKSLQNQIDSEIKRVEDLKKSYEALEKQLEKVFAAHDMERVTEEMNKNLEEQIRYTENMIALEESKKKSDDSRVESWKKDIDDMRELMEKNIEDVFSSLTSGILDNVLDASRGFVDAWYEAFKETGDGISGLKDTFKDMLLDMLKQQASLNVMGKYADQYKNWLKEYVNEDDTEFTKDEAAEYASRVKETFDSVNKELEGYLGAMGEITDQFENGELSGLQKGIQGITEDQAEVLASYWNSCRFLLSNIDMTLTGIADRVLGGKSSSNPTETAIREQTVVITEIRNMLSSVIGSGGQSTHSMSYLRVNDA